MAARPLNKDLLVEALEKAADTDVQVWANQTGIDAEVFWELMFNFMQITFVANPLAIHLFSDDNLKEMISSYGAAFQVGWYARVLQKESNGKE